MEFLENIIEELEKRKEEHIKKAEKIDQIIKNIEKETFISFEIKIKSVLAFSGGKNISFVKRGSLKEVLNEAEEEFKKINYKKDLQDIFLFYSVKALINSQKKQIKIPIKEKYFKKYCSIIIRSTK